MSIQVFGTPTFSKRVVVSFGWSLSSYMATYQLGLVGATGAHNAYWSAPYAGKIYALAVMCCFDSAGGSGNVSKYIPYVLGSGSVGPATSYVEPTTTPQYLFSTGGTYAFAANANIGISVYANAGTNGNLYSQAWLAVAYN